MIRAEYDIFLVVYEEKSLSKASDILDKHQGALSKVLAKLEEELMTPLFVRTNRGLIPTDEGHRLYQQVLQQKNLWLNFQIQSQKESQDVTGLLRIGGHSSVLSQFVESFARISSSFPKLELDFSFDRSPQITRKILNHELDIAIVANPFAYDDLVIRILKKENVGLYSECADPSSFIIYNPDLISSASILKSVSTASNQLLAVRNYSFAGQLAKKLRGSAILPESVALKEGLHTSVSEPFFIGKLCLIYRADHLLNRKVIEVGFHDIKTV
ncbi:MAG: LysR family transcriptional regulator [Bdellovibrionales bacterium]|nr:LysR family transcriptional regulator [Bdellovibrionales bacterium]